MGFERLAHSRNPSTSSHCEYRLARREASRAYLPAEIRKAPIGNADRHLRVELTQSLIGRGCVKTRNAIRVDAMLSILKFREEKYRT